MKLVEVRTRAGLAHVGVTVAAELRSSGATRIRGTNCNPGMVGAASERAGRVAVDASIPVRNSSASTFVHIFGARKRLRLFAARRESIYFRRRP